MFVMGKKSFVIYFTDDSVLKGGDEQGTTLLEMEDRLSILNEKKGTRQVFFNSTISGYTITEEKLDTGGIDLGKIHV